MLKQKFPLFPLQIPHKGKNKGKYISFHCLMGWKACRIRKVQEISLQIPIFLIQQTGIEISSIPRDLIIVIFYYQISLKSLKTLSLSQVRFSLLFPLYYIVPWVFTNSDKGKNKGAEPLLCADRFTTSSGRWLWTDRSGTKSGSGDQEKSIKQYNIK